MQVEVMRILKIKARKYVSKVRHARRNYCHVTRYIASDASDIVVIGSMRTNPESIVPDYMAAIPAPTPTPTTATTITNISANPFRNVIFLQARNLSFARLG